jgi:hypothetical protein
MSRHNKIDLKGLSHMQKRKRSSLEAIQENLTLFLIVLLCIAISVLDFFGLLDGIPVISQRIPAIIVLLLAALTAYIVFSQPHKMKEVQAQKMVDTVARIDSLQETRVRLFADTVSCIDYASQCVAEAKSRVWGMFWDVDLNFDQLLTNDLLYRQILLIDDKNRKQHQSKVRTRLRKSGVSQSFAYFSAERDATLQFMLIDSSEVIFLSNVSSYNIAIRHSGIARVFEHHYDEIWQKAIKLKQNDRINTDRVDIVLNDRLNIIPADLEECVRECLKAQEQRRLKQSS